MLLSIGFFPSFNIFIFIFFFNNYSTIIKQLFSFLRESGCQSIKTHRYHDRVNYRVLDIFLVETSLSWDSLCNQYPSFLNSVRRFPALCIIRIALDGPAIAHNTSSSQSMTGIFWLITGGWVCIGRLENSYLFLNIFQHFQSHLVHLSSFLIVYQRVCEHQ